MTCKRRLSVDVLSSGEEETLTITEDEEKKSSTSSKLGIGIVSGSGEFIKSEPA